MGTVKTGVFDEHQPAKVCHHAERASLATLESSGLGEKVSHYGQVVDVVAFAETKHEANVVRNGREAHVVIWKSMHEG